MLVQSMRLTRTWSRLSSSLSRRLPACAHTCNGYKHSQTSLHLADREVDKSLTKGFAGNCEERSGENRRHKYCELAWVDLNHRPHPYQASAVWFYKNLQDRGDCHTPRKPYKTIQTAG